MPLLCFKDKSGIIYRFYLHLNSLLGSSLYTKAYSAFTSADFIGGDTENIELDEFNNPAKKTTNARALSTGTTQKAEVTYAYDDDHRCVKESAVVTISGSIGFAQSKRISGRSRVMK